MVLFVILLTQYHGNPVANVAPSRTAGGVFSPFASSRDFVTLKSPNEELGGGYFGYSVAVSGNLVVVGTVGGSDPHVYVFDTRTGGVISTLTSPSAQLYAGGFGQSVATDGSIVVVGAPIEDASGLTRAGHSYLFDGATGTLISTLTSPNAQIEGEFGHSVALSGNVVVVSTPFEESNGFSKAGRAYVFNATTGSLIYALASPDAATFGLFGASVSTNDNQVVVGAEGESANSQSRAGRVYVFNVTNGALISTLTSPNVQSFGFGSSVDVSGNFVVVGAPLEGVNGQVWAGTVYTFNAATGVLISTLTSPNAESSDLFGWSVGTRGNLVVVGAPFEAASGLIGAGRAYTFNGVTGSLISMLKSPNIQVGEGFGFAVAASGNTLAIGAPFVAGNAYMSKLAPASA
jgi:hypothetical protein